MPSSGIAGSYGSFILGFARNLHTILHSGCINLHSTNTARGFPFYISSPVVIFRRRQWQPTPILLPGKSHGQRRLVGCNPWDCEESTWLNDFTLTFHFHALEKEMATHSNILAWRIPRMGAWWAAVYGVPQSQTRLTWLSSSSSYCNPGFDPSTLSHSLIAVLGDVPQI